MIATLHAPSMYTMAMDRSTTGTGADLDLGDAIGFIVEENGAGKLDLITSTTDHKLFYSHVFLPSLEAADDGVEAGGK